MYSQSYPIIQFHVPFRKYSSHFTSAVLCSGFPFHMSKNPTHLKYMLNCTKFPSTKHSGLCRSYILYISPRHTIYTHVQMHVLFSYVGLFSICVIFVRLFLLEDFCFMHRSRCAQPWIQNFRIHRAFQSAYIFIIYQCASFITCYVPYFLYMTYSLFLLIYTNSKTDILTFSWVYFHIIRQNIVTSQGKDDVSRIVCI